MIAFSPIRTRRLAVQLREVSIADAIRLASIPGDHYEDANTQFLARSVQSAGTPTPRHVADPLLWSVQERMFVVCHYLAHVLEGGGAFEISDTSRYPDYLMAGVDFPDAPVRVGMVAMDDWDAVPLLGAHAQAIEALAGHVDGAQGRFHWVVGAMAAMLRRKGEEPMPDPVASPNEYQDALSRRMGILMKFPESDFAALASAWAAAREKLDHLFRIDFDDLGVIALPMGGEGAKPSARFPVRSCLSDLAKVVFGRTGRARG